MTTVAQLRRAAAGLPEVTEGTHFGMPSFAVRGAGFASVRDDRVQLRLGPDDVEAVLARYPAAERVERSGAVLGVSVPLADVDGQALAALVRAAWSDRAPRRLAAALAAADRAEPGQGDLPAGIGRPATRALHAAGLTTLDLVAGRSRAELLALHGVGPRAVRILGEALAGRGVALD